MGAAVRVGIAGYGNLGRGVELAVAKNADLRLVGVFTRRDPSQITTCFPESVVYPWDDLLVHRDEIDVLVLCGGSSTDLPRHGPELAASFNLVDSFDTHARIPAYFAEMDSVALAHGRTALIAAGWDPGLFSIHRVLGEALLPDGASYTFWGRGLSQGHSDALRRVPGVAGGVQYTLPSDEAIELVRNGSRPELTTRQRHARECFVVLAEGADPAEVTRAIVTMPHYFDDYDTTVNFISSAELERDHAAMPHGGFVLRSGRTSPGHDQLIEFRLALESNPEFTASVLVAYARAVHRLSAAGQVGAKTVFDVPPAMLSPKPPEQLRAELL